MGTSDHNTENCLLPQPQFFLLICLNDDNDDEYFSSGISCVQFDDTRIASGSYDKTIRVWDIRSGDCDAVLTLAGHSGTVRCLNLNGNRLVSGSVDRSIKVCILFLVSVSKDTTIKLISYWERETFQ